MEIKELKSKLTEPSVNSSILSLPKDENDNGSDTDAVKKALSERDKQLLDLKTQLQVATKEMEQSTDVIKKLKQERDDNKRKIEELNTSLKELKKQLNGMHERCQNLQNDISFQETTIREKDAEVSITRYNLTYFILH